MIWTVTRASLQWRLLPSAFSGSFTSCCFALLLILATGSNQRAALGMVLYDEDHLHAEDDDHFHPEGFTLLGGRAWNPGPNSARVGGNPAPGGATFSIMGANFEDVSGFDPTHQNAFFDYKSQSITSLNVAGFAFIDYVNMFDAALDVWDAASGFTNLGFVADGNVDAGALQANGGHLGDIRIAAWNITGLTVLAHAFAPATEANIGPGGTIGGDVHIDTENTWLDNPNATGSQLDLFTVVLHELGHSLGLGHSADTTSVMFATYQGGRRNLSADDIAGIRAIYGPPEVVPEPGTFVLMFSAGGIISVWGLRRRSRVVS